MIIKSYKDYATTEELEKLEAYEQETLEAFKKKDAVKDLSNIYGNGDTLLEDLEKILGPNLITNSHIVFGIISRYMADRKDNPEQLLEDLEDTLATTNKETFKKYLLETWRDITKSGRKAVFDEISGLLVPRKKQAGDSDQPDRPPARHYNYSTAMAYLVDYADFILSALNGVCKYTDGRDQEPVPIFTEETKAKALYILNATAAEWYPKTAPKKATQPEPEQTAAEIQAIEAYNESIGTYQYSLFDDEKDSFLLYEGKATQILQTLSFQRQEARLDPISGDLSAELPGNTKVVLQEYKKLGGDLDTPTLKVLNIAEGMLAAQNPFRGKGRPTINPVISIDLDDVIRLFGEDIDRHPVKTEAEKKAQEKRINNIREKYRVKFKTGLRTLSRLVISWEDLKGHNKGNYADVHIIGSNAVKGQHINFSFDPIMAAYLCNSYPAYIPKSILGIDDRKPNSYRVAIALNAHYTLDRNSRKGTNDRLSVYSIINSTTGIMTEEEFLETGRRDWKTYIKTKVDNSLDDCVSCGYLAKWNYYDKILGPLSKEQANGLSLSQYCKLFVDYQPVSDPILELEQSERRDRRAIEAKERAEKAAKKAKKKAEN